MTDATTSVPPSSPTTPTTLSETPTSSPLRVQVRGTGTVTTPKE